MPSISSGSQRPGLYADRVFSGSSRRRSVTVRRGWRSMRGLLRWLRAGRDECHQAYPLFSGVIQALHCQPLGGIDGPAAKFSEIQRPGGRRAHTRHGDGANGVCALPEGTYRGKMDIQVMKGSLFPWTTVSGACVHVDSRLQRTWGEGSNNPSSSQEIGLLNGNIPQKTPRVGRAEPVKATGALPAPLANAGW